MNVSYLRKFLLWEIINPLILSLKKRRKYKIKDGIKGVNIGCGIDNAPGWIGLDGGLSTFLSQALPKFLFKFVFKKMAMSAEEPFEVYYQKIKQCDLIHHELNYGLPFEDNSVPNIYSSHFFEHLFKKDAEKLLKECYRVLQPGGTIRICVPNIADAVEKIERALCAYHSGDIHQIQPYVTEIIDGYQPHYSFHRWMYSIQDLQKTLKDAGFIKVNAASKNVGDIADVEKLDIRGGIFAEAMKPVARVDTEVCAPSGKVVIND